MYEDTQTEFEELNHFDHSLPRSLAKEIIAFANTEGGEIYIGIADNGSIVGVDDTDDVMTKITSLVHDTILPDLLPYMNLSILNKENKNIVKISVQPGIDRPYYLKSYGLTPQGVYIRVGSSCHNLTESGIRNMIVESSGLHWESQRCFNQDLTFKALDEALGKAGIEKTEYLYANLKLIGRDRLYTNTALAFSDQCPISTVIKVYENKDPSICTNVKVCKGSIISQIQEAFDFIDGQNRQFPEITGLERSYEREYAPEAIREALLNSVLHRDYSLEGNNMITKFPDRLEFLSRGALPDNLTLEELFLGASVPVNPNILEIFIALHYVEGLGFGIKKMQSLSNNNNAYASFKTTEGYFLATLHVRGAGKDPSSYDIPDDTRNRYIFEPETDYRVLDSEDEKKVILNLVDKRGNICRKDIEMALSISQTKAYMLLKELESDGILIQEKRGRASFYHKKS